MRKEDQPEISMHDIHSISLVRDLALHSAIEIDYYQREKKIISNSFSKLSKVLYATLEPRPFLKGKRPIDNYETYWILYNTLVKHEETKKETPYKIDKINKTIRTHDLVDKLVPIINKISEDLSSFTETPKEHQGILVDFLLKLFEGLSSYETGFRQYLVA